MVVTAAPAGAGCPAAAAAGFLLVAAVSASREAAELSSSPGDELVVVSGELVSEIVRGELPALDMDPLEGVREWHLITDLGTRAREGDER